MTSIIEPRIRVPRLRALDPDLPMLSAQAAMELDNYRSSGLASFEAVKSLSQRLKNSFTPTVPRKALLDSGTVTLVGRAFHSTLLAGKEFTVDQLSDELWEMAERLEKVESDPAHEPIEEIRDFCVALSECAASCRQAFHELRPAHPFRR